MRTHGKPNLRIYRWWCCKIVIPLRRLEVLASALQNNQRAKVYGETSYGKGSIQSIVPINDNEAVKANGRSLLLK